MAPRKPSGKIGPICVENGPSGLELTWQQFSFSEDKAEIERQVVSMFTREMERATGAPIHAKQNDENDLDFLLEMPGGPVLLELTELHSHIGMGSPYASGDLRIDVAPFVGQTLHASSINRRTTALPAQRLITS